MHNSDENGFFDFSWIKLLIAKMLNYGFYWGLAGLYTLIVEISNSEILSTAAVSNFFGKVQLIIGIVMMFRLSVTILQGIVDPDKAVDSQAGMGNIVVKVLTGLVLLAMLMPLSNMPAKGLNHYEDNVRRNGILFGTLYEVQARVLDNNIITKLVLNTKDKYPEDEMKNMGNIMAAAVLKTFFTPNLKEEEADTTVKVDQNGKYDDDLLFCKPDSLDDMEKGMKYSDYYKSNNPGEILDMIDQECGDHYAYNFNWLPALIVGALMCVILIALCIGIAKRAIKLAILRLIAPIPIISYMGSNTDINNSKLGNWIQMLVTTYVDLYITLAIIFFAVSIINDIAINGLKVGDGEASVMAKVFIYIGLLLFAREAPKFIKQALGLKDEGGGLMGSVAAGLGMAALGGKKLAGGTYNKMRGGSFRDGAGAFQGDGAFSKLMNKKNEIDKNNETLQAKRQGKQEVKQMNKDYNAGYKWYNKEKPYKNKEFQESIEARDNAKDEYKSALEAYSEIQDSGGMIRDAQSGQLRKATSEEIRAARKKVEDTKGAYEGTEKVHESVRKQHAKDAKREDQLTFYDHNKEGKVFQSRKENRDKRKKSELEFNSSPKYESETLHNSSGSYSSVETPQSSTPQPTTEGSRYKSENRR